MILWFQLYWGFSNFLIFKDFLSILCKINHYHPFTWSFIECYNLFRVRAKNIWASSRMFTIKKMLLVRQIIKASLSTFLGSLCYLENISNKITNLVWKSHSIGFLISKFELLSVFLVKKFKFTLRGIKRNGISMPDWYLLWIYGISTCKSSLVDEVIEANAVFDLSEKHSFFSK